MIDLFKDRRGKFVRVYGRRWGGETCNCVLKSERESEPRCRSSACQHAEVGMMIVGRSSRELLKLDIMEEILARIDGGGAWMTILFKLYRYPAMGIYLNCLNCGTANGPQARFCTKCGAGLNAKMGPPANTSPPYFQQPPGSTPGAFPREDLITGETIFWEGKPALIAYIIAPIVFTILGALLLVVPALGMIIIFFGVIGIAVNYLRWTRTAFALTDRRVLTKYGVFSTRSGDCAHDKIQNTVVLKPFIQTILGYGTLSFSTAGITGGVANRSPFGAVVGGAVQWDGLPHPAEVKRYVEEVIEASKNQTKKQEYQMMAETLGQKQNVQPKPQIEERLAKIKQLKDSNSISQEEYEEIRKKILMET